MNPSTALAAALVDELIAGGVTDIVLAPGSRSAPLAFALHAADAAGRLRLHVRVDERGAGFLAIGLARVTGRPAGVVTTSGTAVANLHPAVLEAHHDAVPLLVLSADRPAHLHGVGANQTIDQRSVFASAELRYRQDLATGGTERYLRGQVCRALAGARGHLGMPGPAQLNIGFDLPLVPGEYDAPLRDAVTGKAPAIHIAAPGQGAAIAPPEPGEKCLIIADLTHPQAGPLAAAGYLVISEAGGLAGPGVLAAGLHLLADDAFVTAHLPERVIVLGRPTLYRSVTSLLARTRVDVVDYPARFADTAGTVRNVAPDLGEMVSGGAHAVWSRAWVEADAAAGAAVAGVLDATDIGNSAVLARTLAAALPETATLFIGSSQPPRDIGRFARPRSGIRVLANRGVAGIDGALSTAIGMALASAGPAYALLGDLTFLHDVTALAIGPHEPRPDLTVVVANNDGGGIFHTLEQGEAQYAGVFERVFGTPTGVALAQVCEGFGASHELVTTSDELLDLIRELPDGLRVIEVPVSRTDLREQAATVAAAVSRALS